MSFGHGCDVCVWVVKQELDLNNPKTFRNLAKPMGAQTDDRLTQYKKRYKDWEDPNGKIFESHQENKFNRTYQSMRGY